MPLLAQSGVIHSTTLERYLKFSTNYGEFPIFQESARLGKGGSCFRGSLRRPTSLDPSMLSNEMLEDNHGIAEGPSLATEEFIIEADHSPHSNDLQGGMDDDVAQDITDARKASLLGSGSVPSVCSPNKRKNTNSGLPSKKSKISEDKDALLAKHISDEKQKCEALGLECPERCFNSTMVQRHVSTWQRDIDKRDFKIIFFAIASSQALAQLQDVVQIYRSSVTPEFMASRSGVSSAKRVEAIEHLDQTVAYLGLLKRCHILHLFRDHRSPGQRTNDGFITTSADSMNSATARLGNPLHRAEAESTRAMMREVYPDLQEDTAEGRKRNSFVKRLRKLGQRLDLLVSKFGLGILGLLPLPGATSITENCLSITDDMCVAPIASSLLD